MRNVFAKGVLCAALCALQFGAFADAKAPAKIPVVTRNNFVMFGVKQWGGRSNEKSELLMRDNAMTYTLWLPARQLANSAKVQPIQNYAADATLSNNQLAEFIRQLNAAQFSVRSPNEKSRRYALADATQRSMTLTISDAKNQDQTFELGGSPDRNLAAKGRDFLRFVRSLQSQKIHLTKPEATHTAAPLVTRENLQSITLETSGGFANIKTSLKVWVRHPFSDFTGPALVWSQTSPGAEEKSERRELAETEIKKLIRLLNSARLRTLNGQNFKQPNLADGINEVLTLSLNDGKTCKVSNYGNQAPIEYFVLTRYLRGLQDKN